MTDFWEIFENQENYPENVADRGVPQDTMYFYISSTFLNGLINYARDPKAYLIARYGKFSPDKKLHILEDGKELSIEGYVGLLENSVHSNYTDAPDDIIILAHTPESYWMYYSDRDVSDSCIGRVSRTKFTDFEHYVEMFKETFKLCGKPIELIELPEPTGWITL